MNPNHPHLPACEVDPALTRRERQVAALIGQGRSTTEITELLGIGERTVKHHTSQILQKLAFRSRTQLAVWAFRNCRDQAGGQ